MRFTGCFNNETHASQLLYRQVALTTSTGLRPYNPNANLGGAASTITQANGALPLINVQEVKVRPPLLLLSALGPSIVATTPYCHQNLLYPSDATVSNIVTMWQRAKKPT